MFWRRHHSHYYGGGNFTTKREVCMIHLRFFIIRNVSSPPPNLALGGLSYKPESISAEDF